MAGRVTTGGLIDNYLQCWTYQQINSTHAYSLFGGFGYALNPADSNFRYIGVSVRAVR